MPYNYEYFCNHTVIETVQRWQIIDTRKENTSFQTPSQKLNYISNAQSETLC